MRAVPSLLFTRFTSVSFCQVGLRRRIMFGVTGVAESSCGYRGSWCCREQARPQRKAPLRTRTTPPRPRDPHHDTTANRDARSSHHAVISHQRTCAKPNFSAALRSPSGLTNSGRGLLCDCHGPLYYAAAVVCTISGRLGWIRGGRVQAL